MIQIYDAVERRVVAVGNAIINLPSGPLDVGVTHCVLQPGQRLHTQYSYNLVNTNNGQSVSAECTAVPGAGMQIASFHLN